MTKQIVIDIETLPCANPDQIAYLLESVTPDSRLKDPEKVAADIAQKKQEVVGKTGLDGSFGRILMASVGVVGSGDIWTGASAEANEADVLNGLMAEIERIAHDGVQTPIPPILIGHNLPWDLRFIAQRCVVNGVKFSRRLLPFDDKPWSDRIIDTMTVWAGNGNRISLDRLCHALGVKSPKGDMDGSQVAQYFADGKLDQIIAYNREDVRATMECFIKMTEAGMV